MSGVAVPRRNGHHASSTPAVLFALVPAVAWGTLLVVGTQLHENLCSTGATPDRGMWFGLDLRVPTIVLGVAAAVLAIAAGVTLLQIRRDATSDANDVVGARAFVATLGLVSSAFFLLIIVATIVNIGINPPC